MFDLGSAACADRAFAVALNWQVYRVASLPQTDNPHVHRMLVLRQVRGGQDDLWDSNRARNGGHRRGVLVGRGADADRGGGRGPVLHTL